MLARRSLMCTSSFTSRGISTAAGVSRVGGSTMAAAGLATGVAGYSVLCAPKDEDSAPAQHGTKQLPTHCTCPVQYEAWRGKADHE
jgi:hypothetical protein